MYYTKLHKLGHPLEYLDVGGGLAIDYDGSRSTFHSSMNYTMEEYANDIVYNIMDVCDDERVPHPNIVSESTAIVAHPSCSSFRPSARSRKTPEGAPSVTDPDVRGSEIDTRSARHPPDDLQRIKEQAQTMFQAGLLNLESRPGWNLVLAGRRAQAGRGQMDPEGSPRIET